MATQAPGRPAVPGRAPARGTDHAQIDARGEKPVCRASRPIDVVCLGGNRQNSAAIEAALRGEVLSDVEILRMVKQSEQEISEQEQEQEQPTSGNGTVWPWLSP